MMMKFDEEVSDGRPRKKQRVGSAAEEAIDGCSDNEGPAACDLDELLLTPPSSLKVSAGISCGATWPNTCGAAGCANCDVVGKHFLEIRKGCRADMLTVDLSWETSDDEDTPLASLLAAAKKSSNTAKTALAKASKKTPSINTAGLQLRVVLENKEKHSQFRTHHKNAMRNILAVKAQYEPTFKGVAFFKPEFLRRMVETEASVEAMMKRYE